MSFVSPAKQRKNLALLAILFGLAALMFTLTIVKLGALH